MPESWPRWDSIMVDHLHQHGCFVKRARDTGPFKAGWHRHVGMEALLCLNGEGLFYFGDQVVPCVPGTLLLFDPEVPHRVEMPTAYSRWTFCYWPDSVLVKTYAPSLRSEPITLGSGKLYHTIVSQSDSRHLAHLFACLQYETETRRPGFEELLHLYFSALFVWLARMVTEASVRASSHIDHDPLAEILAFIESNLSTPLDIDTLTKRFHCSRSYLYRLMLSRVGKTPSEYIKDRRIAVAQSLLRRTQLTITDIGFAVGFSDVANFSRFFKRETGLSPSAYRARILENSSA